MLWETASDYSWSSRNLTSEFLKQLVFKFSADCDFQTFEHSSMDMHYNSPDMYYEMLSRITKVMKDYLHHEFSACDGFGQQIDGSS